MNVLEELSEAVHKAYCQYCIDVKGEEYWTKGDYSKLSEEVKEADRYTVKAVLQQLKENEPTKEAIADKLMKPSSFNTTNVNFGVVNLYKANVLAEAIHNLLMEKYKEGE